MVPHTGCAEIRVNRANLTRFTLHEPLWDAWCDSIRVLIRVLAGDLNRFAEGDVPNLLEKLKTA